MTALLEVAGLNKIYATREGRQVVALQDINLAVAAGSFVSIVGPSGCGKSTLLKILAGILARNSGQVALRGTSIDGPRREIGVVFQTPVLLPWWNVLQNVLLPVVVQRRDRAAFTARAQDWLARVGLADFAGKYPNELSGGMQQRVSLCRALVHDPAILLMDEPFGALDAMTREQMNLALQQLWIEAGKTIILVTHSIPEAVFLGDRVVVMTPRPGRIAEIRDVDLPRPRQLEAINSAAFGTHVAAIRRHFGATGNLDH